MHCCHRFPLIMDFSHYKIHKEREEAWICHSASNWAVPTERCRICLVPTWKAKHSQKQNPLSEHLLPHYLHFHFIFSPSGCLSSKVCWIKFGFHLYPAREIHLQKRAKMNLVWFPLCISLAAMTVPACIRWDYFFLCEESVVWLMVLLNMMMAVQRPALITPIW